MHLPMLWGWLNAKLHMGERDERGANLVEYIILVAFIALIVIAAIVFFQQRVSSEFTEAGTSLEGAPA